MFLQYHRRAVALLAMSPHLNGSRQASLAHLEMQQSIQLPAAVREWFSLTEALEQMRRFAFIHDPVDPATLTTSDLIVRSPDTPAPRMLPVLYENQGIWQLAVPLLPGEEDPPVLVGIQTDANQVEGWHRHAESFSDFILAWAWDSLVYAEDGWGFRVARSQPLPAFDDPLHRALFTEGPITYRGNAYLQFSHCTRYLDDRSLVSETVPDVWL